MKSLQQIIEDLGFSIDDISEFINIPTNREKHINPNVVNGSLDDMINDGEIFLSEFKEYMGETKNTVNDITLLINCSFGHYIGNTYNFKDSFCIFLKVNSESDIEMCLSKELKNLNFYDVAVSSFTSQLIK